MNDDNPYKSNGPNPKPMKVFIPSVLDEYGLKPSVFRVYCHIARSNGKGNGAWPAIASMSRMCHLHPQTIRTALKFLVAEGFLTREKRRGMTTVYCLNPMYMWKNLKPIKAAAPNRKGYRADDLSEF
jgi:hypothetical protein